MKIVIAPDSFKESMTAYEAAKAMESGILQYRSDIITDLCPMADGGEGTLETLVQALHGKIVYEEVTGPLFQKMKAPIGYTDDIAIIECAKVCGLELLDENQKDPYQTTTYGLGELILKAMKRVHHIWICLGGSATNDGGIGMLSALGARFYNQYHQQVTLTMDGLKDICEIDLSHLHPMLSEMTFVGVCDVTNPLCGKQGATAIYGPQKGVKNEEISSIDQAMEHYALQLDTLLHHDYRLISGSGAAGGLGYALLSVCQAQLQSGFQVVSQTTHLEEKIKEASCVFVGEGKIDQQTQYGKTPYGVLEIAKKYHKPVWAFAGKVSEMPLLKQWGFTQVLQISPSNLSLSQALKQGKDNLEKTVFASMEEVDHVLQSR